MLTVPLILTDIILKMDNLLEYELKVTKITQDNVNIIVLEYEEEKKRIGEFVHILGNGIYMDSNFWFKYLEYDEDQIQILVKNWLIFKDINGVYAERLFQFKDRKAEYIMELYYGHQRIMSMQVFEKIGDCQFHMHICRDFDNFVECILSNVSMHKNISTKFHKMAMEYTGAKFACAPPLPVMAEIIKKNFKYIELGFSDGEETQIDIFKVLGFSSEGCNPNYSKIFESENMIERANRYWPCIGNLATYCFWP